ncbi:MAG TPA: efflux RND transporter periplasmic adaptor subunit [Chitinophagaceae bacterium]|nr:efflux RND transporter periplasmic adaptor subunit [Chitinophagaceae bacterium]
MKNKIKIETLAFLILFFGFLGCKNEEQIIEKEACLLQEEFANNLSFGNLIETHSKVELDLTGHVSYDEEELYTFQSLVTGIVEKTYFKLGDYVEKDDILLEIRSSAMGEYRHSLSMAQADIDLAIRNLESVQKMHENGFASDRELLEAERELKNSRLSYQQIQETIHLHGGQIEKGLLVIKAPKSGYIIHKNITRGSAIAEGNEDIFSISNLNKIWIKVNIYPTQVGLIKHGEEVEISTSAYPKERFTGRIERISQIFDPEEKVMKAIIELDNPDLKLKPDMMVNVHFLMDTDEKALAIPIDHVLFDKDAYHFVQAIENCDARIVTFQPIGKDKKYYYFHPSNIDVKEGDRFIEKNNLLIYNELLSR